jgi:hypothetical protein
MSLTKRKVWLNLPAGRITSFRAPALRINEDTVESTSGGLGFLSDSSIASQRFDDPLTNGCGREVEVAV